MMGFENWYRSKYPFIASEEEFAMLQDAWKSATNAALERAATVCDDISGNEPSGHGGRYGALDCAAAIRIFKDMFDD